MTWKICWMISQNFTRLDKRVFKQYRVNKNKFLECCFLSIFYIGTFLFITTEGLCIKLSSNGITFEKAKAHHQVTGFKVNFLELSLDSFILRGKSHQLL